MFPHQELIYIIDFAWILIVGGKGSSAYHPLIFTVISYILFSQHGTFIRCQTSVR